MVSVPCFSMVHYKRSGQKLQYRRIKLSFEMTENPKGASVRSMGNGRTLLLGSQAYYHIQFAAMLRMVTPSAVEMVM